MKIDPETGQTMLLQVCQEWKSATHYKAFAVTLSDATNENELHYAISFRHKHRKYPVHYYGIVDLQKGVVILFREMIQKQY